MERPFHEPRKDLAVYVDDWPTQRRLKRQSVGYKSPNSESESSLYHHRAFHSSIVVGQYLYIHGGEITTWNGSDSDATLASPALPDNNTYSIDLSSPWTNDTVSLNAIKSGAPTLILQALWEDPSGSSFYAYDGGKSYALPLSEQPAPPANQLWHFTPSGAFGAWSQMGELASSNFTTLQRCWGGYYASGGGLGFALGGHQNTGTGLTHGWTNPPGLVIYNFTSMEWFNLSATGYSFDGTAQSGAAHFVPGYGNAGLLFVLAGSVGNDADYLPRLDSVSMFDPTSRQWASQQTSGTVPMPVVNPCVVGVQGDNDTYEVFFYGGTASDPNQTVVPGAQGAVYVLTLPAFHWLRTGDTPLYRRTLHSCNVVGSRQMVSVGGIVNKAVGEDKMIPDPWPQGLGIFDMSAMEWKANYDPEAKAYVSPNSVKAYYQQNGSYPASWSNDIVKQWFTKATANNTAAANSRASSVPAKESTSSAFSTGSHGISKGTLAGGIVGGVAAFALILLFLLYLLRLRPRRAAPAQPFDLGDGYQKAELEDTKQEVPSELAGVNDGRRGVLTSELPYWQEVHEMPVEKPGLPAGLSHELG